MEDKLVKHAAVKNEQSLSLPPNLEARYDALPGFFREQLVKLKDSGDVASLNTEIMIRESALFLVDKLKTPEAIRHWYNLSWNEQKNAIPELDESFGKANSVVVRATAHWAEMYAAKNQKYLPS